MDLLQEKLDRIMQNVKKHKATTEANSSGREQDSNKCSKCQDRGVIVKGNVAFICYCQQQKRLEKLLKASKITKAFKSKTFSNFKLQGRPAVVRQMYMCAKDYAEKFFDIKDTEHNSLALLGAPGAGKTHLSFAVANYLLKKEVPVLYFQHVEGFSELKDMLRKESKERIAEKINEIKKAPVLIWDDLLKGRKEATDFVKETMFEILNYRYNENLPTIYSSEKTPEQLLAFDNAIGSRIVERAKGHTIVIEPGPGVNYRLC